METELTIDPDWDILGRTNGGYVLARMAELVTNETGQDPVTVTGHYLAPVAAGRYRATIQILKQGKRFTTARVDLFSDRLALTMLGSFGASQGDDVLSAGQPPEIPPAAECVLMRPDPSVGLPPPFMGQVELHLHPADAAFAVGAPTGRAQMRAWFRAKEWPSNPALATILACDSLPPTTFNLQMPLGWTPTLELTVHVRKKPRAEWLRLDAQTHCISNGMLEVDVTVWDSEDNLVGQSRQLALVPTESVTG